MAIPAIMAPTPAPIAVPIPGKRREPIPAPAAAVRPIIFIGLPPPFSDELFIINILSSRFFNT